jgi:hypothetical protein
LCPTGWILFAPWNGGPCTPEMVQWQQDAFESIGCSTRIVHKRETARYYGIHGLTVDWRIYYRGLRCPSL